MKCFNARKWRRNRKNTGALVELSLYNEDKEAWENALVNIPFAAQYAGVEADERPAAMCAVDKGVLVIKVYQYDDYFDEQAGRVESVPKRAAKKKATRESAAEADDDEETDF